MTDLFSLGKLYVSDFLAPGEQPRSEPAELRLVMDDDGMVHLAEQPAPELMWGRYWYRSGTNQSMRKELRSIVESIAQVVKAPEMKMMTSGRPQPARDLWVDIASNDGTLLGMIDTVHYHSATPCPYIRIGVDPVEGEIHDNAIIHADHILQEPFTYEVGSAITAAHGQAKVITCIAMFYDLMDPTDFLAGVHRLLADDGIFVLQVSYTPLMLEQLAFDNICHEHARYYTLTTLSHVLRLHGFHVMDAQLNDTNGGSMRVYASTCRRRSASFSTQPYRDVANMRVVALLSNEERAEYNTPDIWRWFKNRLASLRADVAGFITDAKTQGKTIWCYGASTKGNTLLQYFGLDHTLIDGIAERQEAKWGLRTVGTDIPIYSEEDMRKAKPDYALVLPWQFIGEFIEREADYLAGGGKFIVPCPRFEVIG